MRFGPWHPLSTAAELLPAAPGVLQVRLREGLVRYPRGKSAMIHYAGAADLSRLAASLAASHPAAPWLCRASVGPCAEPMLAAARLLAEFDERFGACPKIPGPEDMVER
ncbi:hypothetical protein [Nannocystis radixulma]|uniref:Uncharacterized protein n=1 Tax=Nannocystis radixulma TaxID=2995305 RepID=A0ABT5B7T9_9BACT|nr:hypothetical protein [Nannocystis radixulma]MDC0669599.1 hypothetical protein [Nannocystis radixulma]